MKSSQSEGRAAQYLRMSTDHQKYSLEMQSLAIARYAAEHGLQVVKTYKDAGISGLSLKHRSGLKSLLSDVVSGAPGFSTILVYDVSRWGRFQDPDQSAYYEFLCKEAGVAVLYTAELFHNDGSVTSSILKTVKRAMAAEYSREISEKVGRTMRALSRKGHWVGGTPPFGYRRQPISARGRRRATLEPGERNGVRGDRIVLVPGPAEEVEIVRRVFRDFVRGMTISAIARSLNEDGIPSPRQKLWREFTIASMLRNETYCGALVRGTRVVRLGVMECVPKTEWIRRENAHEAIVDRDVFRLANRNLRKRREPETDEQMLANLRLLWKRHGYLSHKLMKDGEDVHHYSTYRKRFGDVAKVWERIGYVHTPERAAFQAAAEELVARPRRPKRRD